MNVKCPYCGEWIELDVDDGGGVQQQYIEDCQVCCRPMIVSVDGDRVRASRQDD